MRRALAVAALAAVVLLVWWSVPRATAPPAPAPAPGEPTRAPPVEAGALDDAPPPVVAEPAQPRRSPGAPDPLPTLPEGTLEVQVLLRGQPLVGAVLLTRPAGRDHRPLEADEPIEARRSFVTDERGLARVDALEPAVHLVGLVRPRGVLAQARLNLIHDRSRRHVIELGDARVVGTLFDWEGRPIGGRPVFVGPATPDLSTHHDQGAGALVFVTTDAGGGFAVDELPAGPTMVGVWPESAHTRRRDLRAVNLGAGETRRVDLGRHAQEGGTWRGTVRSASGAAVLDEDRAGRLWLRHADGEQAVVPWSPDGTFLLRLTPGRWRVSVEAPSNGVRRDLGLAVEVGEGTLEQDVVLPGARVWGHLIAGGNVDPAGLSVTLSRTRSSSPADLHTTKARTDGRYELTGIPAGEYLLGTRPQRTEPVKVEVGVELELRVDVKLGE